MLTTTVVFGPISAAAGWDKGIYAVLVVIIQTNHSVAPARERTIKIVLSSADLRANRSLARFDTLGNGNILVS